MRFEAATRVRGCAGLAMEFKYVGNEGAHHIEKVKAIAVTGTVTIKSAIKSTIKSAESRRPRKR